MTYKAFPEQHLLSDWEKLLAQERDSVAELEKQWEEIHAHNRRLSAEQELLAYTRIQEIVRVLEKQGIEVRKPNPNHRRLFVDQEWYAWFRNNVVNTIRKQYPLYYRFDPPKAENTTRVVRGIELSTNRSHNLLELYDTLTKQYEFHNN